MDQCQKIPALHSLEGHKCCQPVCVLQLAGPVPKPCQRTAHYASKVPAFRTKWSFHQHFPSKEEKLHMPPCLSRQNKGSFLFFAVHLQLQNGKKKSCLFFPGSLAYSNTWIFAVSRRGFANKRRTELYLRRTSLWKLSNTLLFFPIPKFPNLEEKKCFSSVGTSLMSACIAHRAS